MYDKWPTAAMWIYSTHMRGEGMPHKMKIITFGDSTTAPRTVDGHPIATYSDILRDAFEPYDVEVVNKGVPGDTTEMAMARFDQDVVKQRPDIVVVQFGINDSTVDVWKTPPATEPRVSLDDYSKNLLSIIHALKAQGATAILMTPNPLRWMSAEYVRLYGRRPYEVTDPMGFNVTIRPYVQALRDIATAEQTSMVDIHRHYIEYGATPGRKMEELMIDGCHPNAAGHRLAAGFLLNTIKSMPHAKTLLA